MAKKFEVVRKSNLLSSSSRTAVRGRLRRGSTLFDAEARIPAFAGMTAQIRFLRLSKSLVVLLFGAVLFAVIPIVARADSITLSVAPPLFQLNAAPGDSWKSSIKVTNPNPADLTIYASVVGFAADSNGQGGKLIPLVNEAGDPDALANWISLSQDSLTVPSGRTMEIGFSIYIPKTASPGGHYAAVMIGTKPAGRSMQGVAVSVGSFVTSLVFMNVKGEAKTGGIITKFSTDRAVYDLPDAKFSLLFQNTGNVYVRPEGGISIYNMWGVKQASIPVNQGTSFGTVLPSSSREFDAEWKGADDFFGIGRYTAVASVAYGSLPGQTVSSTLSFWIFPAGRAAAVLGGMLFFFFVIVFSAKLYVRRALALRPLRRSRMDAVPAAASRETGFDRILLGPIAEGVLDLRKAREASRSVPRPPRNYFWRRWSLFGPLLRKYVAFLVLFPLCILAVLWIAAYLRASFNTEKTYDITVQVSAGSVAPGGNANTVQ